MSTYHEEPAKRPWEWPDQKTMRSPRRSWPRSRPSGGLPPAPWHWPSHCPWRRKYHESWWLLKSTYWPASPAGRLAHQLGDLAPAVVELRLDAHHDLPFSSRRLELAAVCTGDADAGRGGQQVLGLRHGRAPKRRRCHHADIVILHVDLRRWRLPLPSLILRSPLAKPSSSTILPLTPALASAAAVLSPAYTSSPTSPPSGVGTAKQCVRQGPRSTLACLPRRSRLRPGG